MNPLRNLFIILSVCIPFFSHAQIRLSGYKCKYYDGQSPNTMAEMYSKTDTFRFTLYTRDIWGEEQGEDTPPAKELKIGLRLCFDNLHYFKTKDDLYIYTGKIDGANTYIYKVYIPNQQVSLSVCSGNNDSLFSEKSKWLLSQIRTHKTKDVFLVNEKGQDCQNPYKK